jgi:flagellar motor component MotA
MEDTKQRLMELLVSICDKLDESQLESVIKYATNIQDSFVSEGMRFIEGGIQD